MPLITVTSSCSPFINGLTFSHNVLKAKDGTAKTIIKASLTALFKSFVTCKFPGNLSPGNNLVFSLSHSSCSEICLSNSHNKTSYFSACIMARVVPHDPAPKTATFFSIILCLNN